MPLEIKGTLTWYVYYAQVSWKHQIQELGRINYKTLKKCNLCISEETWK